MGSKLRDERPGQMRSGDSGAGVRLFQHESDDWRFGSRTTRKALSQDQWHKETELRATFEVKMAASSGNARSAWI